MREKLKLSDSRQHFYSLMLQLRIFSSPRNAVSPFSSAGEPWVNLSRVANLISNHIRTTLTSSHTTLFTKISSVHIAYLITPDGNPVVEPYNACDGLDSLF
jgi:hypothetical protein